jgi:hypothetical protein
LALIRHLFFVEFSLIIKSTLPKNSVLILQEEIMKIKTNKREKHLFSDFQDEVQMGNSLQKQISTF